jgi:predicted dehydrogenase
MMGCEHIRNVNALADAEVVAVADPHPPSLDEARRAASGPIDTHDTSEALLARDDLDALVIATPNHTHRRELAAVWNTDLHVMIEKPLCTTVDDCLDVQQRARVHAGLVWMGLEYRYMPAVTQFLGRVRSGEIGRLHMISIREHRYPFLTKVGNWNRHTANTGGTLVEKCCHFFDLMHQATGERPIRVIASGGQDVNHLDETYDGRPSDILDNAFVIVEFASGARGLLDLCMFAEGSRWEQELVAVGDRGKVEAHLPGFMESSRGRTSELVVGKRGEGWPVDEHQITGDERIRYEGGHHGSSYLELLEFCEAIRSGSAAAVTVDDGLWSVAAGAAAHRSIDEQRPVELAEFGLDPTAP